MLRRHRCAWILSTALLLGGAVIEGVLNVATAQSGQISLQEMLETGLKARRPEEFQFIAKVVGKVNQGTIPRSLVEGTFFWARNKQPYPFPYFERGLKERAKRLNITI